MTPEQQYLALAKRIIDTGTPIFNERTGKTVLTVINADLTYTPDHFPLLTTRKCFYKAAIAEILGYLRGYTSAADFRALGTRTWDANANENEAWLKNPNRKGVDDAGLIYGYHLHSFAGSGYNQLQKVYDNLKRGMDDRGEILSMWAPSYFDKGCLRPCLYQYQFSLLGDTLHLHATQRSCDLMLGGAFNMTQVWVLLYIMAHITGHKMGNCYHKIVNAHIYEDQIEGCMTQLSRTPYAPPTLTLDNPNVNTLDDVLTHLRPEDFILRDYRHHDPIHYPFSV